ncbi:hypothetical protein NQ176_g2171 [Zarea fungicola]|uniref:Uncharacterized protein n=1 Tax=Zarea fungicola TaxID=93591 RepID=A0ACC1NPJ4_9HYPO|nr:hypothetical protein NQ176_g2171 [Lecanicillium fungicola]
MASAHPRPAGLPASSNGTPIKKRKVRKGTQSCWECKRRKIRCTFAAPTDSICDGCKSRQTKCISQEYQDEPPSAGRKVDRIKRMESIIEGLVKHNKSPSTGEKDVLGGNQDSKDSVLTATQDVSDAEDSKAVNKRDSSPSFFIPMGVETSSPRDLCRYLISLWPNQSDLDYILDAQVSISVLLHCVVCQPYEGYFEKYIAPARQLLQRPTEDLHPVLAARNMLLLVTLLISVPPSTIDENPSLRKNHRSLTVRVFNAATRLVTSNDDLMGSIEGIECAMLECMYLVNLGNLRRAWLANRRGMVLAQMMGMQTGKSTSSIVVLDHKTLDRVRPDYMWFRLVCADRHLSLLLGLPQATTENVFAAPGILESHPPLERFERIMTVACSLILQRNIAESNDLETTYEIDKTLQRASTLLPPQWWLMATPDAISVSARDDTAFKETVRLMNQFIYHHLLVQLHLPYMMVHSTADPRYDYSKMTVANSARAILTRFTAFHGTIISTAYCRCMDFIAFIAATTLCMAHIEARRQHAWPTAG